MGSANVSLYAPPAYNGLVGNAPGGFVDLDFSYVFTVTLLGNQFLRDQSMNIMTDADFLWRALQVTANTGAFNVRFADSQATYLSNAQLNWTNFFWGANAIPWPVFPQLVIPAGGRIGIDIQDLSGNPNTVELTFRGAKRYRVPVGQ